MLCAASCLRAGCGVLAGGAKASLSTKFAKGADVGELNAVSENSSSFSPFVDRLWKLKERQRKTHPRRQ